MLGSPLSIARLAGGVASILGGVRAFVPGNDSFVMTHNTGLQALLPSNLRAGLSSSVWPQGGFIEELKIAVTGTAGSATLTTAETTKVAGLVQTYWEGALNSTDGTQDFFATVVANNGSTTITLKDPLVADFSGTISAKYDANNGQHATAAGTRVNARLLAEARREDWSLGPWRGGAWWRRGSSTTGFTFSGTTGVSAAPIVVAGIQNGAASNILENGSTRIVRTSAFAQAGKEIGTLGAGAAGIFTYDANGEDVSIEFYTGAYRGSTNLNGVASIEVSIEADGVPVAMKVDGVERTSPHVQDNIMRHYKARIDGATQIVVRWENLDGAIYYITANHLNVRMVEEEGPIFTPQSKILVSMDSWGQYYGNDGDGLFEDLLEEFTGATVIKNSVGGMTSEFTKGWLSKWLEDNPGTTHLVFGMNINDGNNLFGFSFNDPDGNPQPLWPYNAASGQSLEILRQNVAEIRTMCRAAGVEFVAFMPAGTASGSQAQALAGAALYVEPSVPFEMRVLATEFTSATSVINQNAKDAGVRHFDVTNNRWMVANGSTPTATWTQQGGGTTVTPVYSVGPAILSGFSRTIPENTALDYRLSSDEDVTWTITGGADQALFSVTTIDSKQAMLSLPAQDFEAPADADTNNQYVVQVTATRGGFSTNRTVTITISNVGGA